MLRSVAKVSFIVIEEKITMIVGTVQNVMGPNTSHELG